MMKSFFGSAVLTAFITGSFGAFVPSAHAVTVASGDLIRGTTFSAVYYMGADGFRYVFPNEKTYKTWYADANGNPDFSDVIMISDSALADIQMGGNVTYKPGVKMIKINTDPKTYVVTQGGTLHHVDSENVAQALYGASWNTMIEDVPDGFFGNYTISTESAAKLGNTWSVAGEIASVPSINVDKGLIAPEEIALTDSGYSPIDVTICVDQTVLFVNEGDDKHTVTADDLTWGSGTMESGDDFTRRFSEEGTFTFYDGYDSTNTGAIYVENCD